WQTLRRILVPLTLPGIVSGSTMVFIPALTTFVISALLGGNKVLLVGNIIEQEFTAAYDWQLGSALSMVLMVFILLNIALEAFSDQKDRARGRGAA
ncbi:MAG: ABC transporter permease subunit, partial [Veillonellaceae bacterium]|nr:ABC transporter permease subunit [Veillonellaceae bacterium]